MSLYPPLNCFIKDSFGYLTIRKRLPNIIIKVIDFLNEQIYSSNQNVEDIKMILGRVVKLKHNLCKSSTLELPFKDSFGDVHQYNEFFESFKSCNPSDPRNTWLNLPWLPTECYFYRKIFECFQLSEFHKDVDYFSSQKNEMYTNCEQLIQGSVGNVTNLVNQFFDDKNQVFGEKQELLKTHLHLLLQFALWGNKYDMSLSAGEAISHNLSVNEAHELTHMREEYLLCDHFDEGIEVILKGNLIVHYVLDNSGMELASDLCLIYFLLKCGLASKIHIHIKKIPWFVSDVMNNDFFYMLKQFEKTSPEFYNSFTMWIKDETIVLNENLFWVGPWSYPEMCNYAPDLYKLLSSGDLCIFKGDLNYRKLVSDLKWPNDTPFSVAVENFKPSPILALRTLKSCTTPEVANKKKNIISSLPNDWMYSGSYAVVHFSP